jgi:hypothetical protein
MARDEAAREDIRLARAQIRNAMRFPLWITLFVGIVLLVLGVRQESDFSSWLLWMIGGALIALSIGMWLAFDWARTAYGILGTIVCAIFVFDLVAHRPQLDLASGIKIFQVLFWGWIALYAFLPSTRRLFARAKGAPAKVT